MIPPMIPPHDTPQDTGIVRLLESNIGIRRDEQKTDPRSLGPEEYQTRPQNLSVACLQAGLIEMTIPDKPRSSKQHYRLTPAGREYLHKSKEQDNGGD